MIILKNISKKYSENIVLNRITTKIQDNSVTGIIGPNGAGKSTLLRIISGFEFSDHGDIFINSKKTNNFKNIHKQISYMPENMSLYPEYFVDEFLDFYHRAIKKRNDELIEVLSLKKILHKKIKYLSKGWHQRLKLYTVLSNNRKIIILDEPFDGFDPVQMRDISKIIHSYKDKGKTFILSIHQLSYAEKNCDFFIFLNKGRLIAQGSLDELSEKYSQSSITLEEIFVKTVLEEQKVD